MKTNVFFRIVVSFIVGGSIGGVLMNQSMIVPWWVGGPLCGLIAYLIVDLENLIKEIPLAYERTCQKIHSIAGRLEEIRKGLNKELLVLTLAKLTLISTPVLGFILVILMLMNGIYLIDKQIDSTISLVYGLIHATGITAFIATSIFCFVIGGHSLVGKRDIETFTMEQQKKFFLLFNPISFFLFTTPRFYVNLAWRNRKSIRNFLIIFIPVFFLVWMIKFVLFIEELFRGIHSQLRLICGVDCAIGGLIGYFFFDGATATILGIVIGLAIGLPNYYFVAIRWLKLKPRI